MRYSELYLTNKKVSEHEIEYRKMKALEIIAEQIINLDNTLACVVACLENIKTTLNRG